MTSQTSRITVTKTELPPLRDYVRYLEAIWRSHWVTNNGTYLLDLEKKLQHILKTKYVIAVTNGTIALQLVLKALPKHSGEIITTPFTFQATTNVIAWEGFTPVFADIDKATWNIDPVAVEKLITKKTAAILAVHVYGNACDVEALEVIAKKYNISLLFDSAHAFDVMYMGKQLAQYGDFSTLSFHATKTFHTIEGGAIIAKDAKSYELLKLLRNFGIKNEEEVVSCGINAKMNEFSAAMGLLNLANSAQRLVRREKIYEAYVKNLPDAVVLPSMTVSKQNYTYFPILLSSKSTRNRLYEYLNSKGVGTRKYFYPLTSAALFIRNKHIRSIGADDTPIAKSVSDRVLCLPIYASLQLRDVGRICTYLHQFVNTR